MGPFRMVERVLLAQQMAGYIVVLRHLRVGDASFRLGFLVDMEDTAKIYILLHLKTYELYSFN